MSLDVVTLSRIQFALTIMFHYLFPPLTIGMGVVLVYLEGMYLWKKEPIYETAARFWTQLYALTFAIGVATGIVMEFEFGTNWAAYSRFVGDVFGSALAAEGIFAFFLESGFLAILVFGWDKVGPRFHFVATLFVSLGSIFSALWILVANSWQQTPAGHRIVQMTRDGKPWFVEGRPVLRAEVVDFWAVVFNPSTLNRLTHTLMGAFILGAFFIMSISAYYLLRRRHEDFARRSFTGALLFATVFSLAQLVSGDFNARMVAHQQPAKLAALEGLFETAPADGEGTKVIAAGGSVHAVEAAARRRGTTVNVSRLFYNAPARQKFLRSARSEWRSLLDVISTMVLVTAHSLQSRSVQKKGTPWRYPRNSGGSPSGVSSPPRLETRKMKKTGRCL